MPGVTFRVDTECAVCFSGQNLKLPDAPIEEHLVRVFFFLDKCDKMFAIIRTRFL